MKLSILQENLNKGLGTISRVVSARGSLPILANVLLSTHDGRLLLSATNLELAITYAVGCKVETEGSVSVPARLITEVVAGLGEDKIQLVAAGENLRVKAMNFDSTINGMNPADFPTTPEVTSKHKLTIAADSLLTALSEVALAASPDETRPVLAGVYFQLAGGKLTLAATDSYRLAERKLDVASKLEVNAVVPVRTINEVVRILSSESGDVSVVFGETEILFEIGDVSIVSRLIDGKFPNYQQIIPSKSDTTALLDKAALLANVKLSSVFARESANTIKLQLTKTQLKLSSSASAVGENTSTVAAKVTGDEAEISLNARYLLDAISIIQGGSVQFGVSGKLDPFVISAAGSKEDYVHIIMPLRS